MAADLASLKTWQEKAAWARSQRDASLAKVSPPLPALPDPLPLSSQSIPASVLTPREIEITERYTVPELLAMLRERKISVEEVTRAFLRRAVVAQAATNCLTELLWDQALARAQYLDSLPAPKGVLFGLPISVKEHHGIRLPSSYYSSSVERDTPVYSHASYVSRIGQPHESSLQLHETLWNEGCVFYARTTQPQTIMHLETENNIYGRTTNPWNRNLTSGGSSGGESALLGMRGSLLGIGGDIGGSIRCPAAHVGIYGFKPTNRRLPVAGQSGHMIGKEAIAPTLGPMCVDRSSLSLFMSVALSNSPWKTDPYVDNRPWTPFFFGDRKPKIGVMWWDSIVRPHPPVTRALRDAVEKCKEAGMEIVEWDCEKMGLDHRKGWEIITSLYWPDGGAEVLGLLKESGEPILPLTKFIIQEQPSVKNLTQRELWDRCVERDSYRTAYARAWASTANLGDYSDEIDVLLTPANFGAATPHEQSRYWGYTSNWNLLDYPAAVFPVTFVDQQLDLPETDYEAKNEEDRFVWEMYSPEKFEGAPVSLQIVGRRGEDERVLAALEEIEKAFGRP